MKYMPELSADFLSLPEIGEKPVRFYDWYPGAKPIDLISRVEDYVRLYETLYFMDGGGI